jgi:hypothetical protein
MGWPILPFMSTPVPVPGFPPYATFILPFVGQTHGGGACAGIFGKGFVVRR